MQATGEIRIRLSAVLDISSLDVLHAKLVSALGRAVHVVIEGAEVLRADTAGLQLLAGFFLSARQQRQTVAWDTPSPALRQSARLLGLSGLLELPL